MNKIKTDDNDSKTGNELGLDEEKEIKERIEVESILKLEPAERTSRNITTILRFFKNNAYFEKQKEIHGEKIIQFLIRKMRFKASEKNEMVFHFGDIGELFYIIMDGEVIIKVPSPAIIEGEKAAAKAFLLEYLVEQFEIVHW